MLLTLIILVRDVLRASPYSLYESFPYIKKSFTMREMKSVDIYIYIYDIQSFLYVDAYIVLKYKRNHSDQLTT